MELLQLKHFCDAAETENLSETARKFLVPTSNISQSVKRLEKDLGVRLFQRSANRIQITTQGKEFYHGVKEALDVLDVTTTQLVHSKMDEIRIHIQVNSRVVLDCIDKFRKIYPNIRFITTHQNKKENATYDIVITDENLDIDYQKFPFVKEKLELAFNRRFFSADTAKSPEGLEAIPYIRTGCKSSLFRKANEIYAALGVIPNVVLQSEDPLYVRTCIEMGLGVTIAPRFSWQGKFSDDIEFMKLGDFIRTTYIYKRISSKFYVNAFVEELIDSLKRNPGPHHTGSEKQD